MRKYVQVLAREMNVCANGSPCRKLRIWLASATTSDGRALGERTTSRNWKRSTAAASKWALRPRLNCKQPQRASLMRTDAFVTF